MNDIAISVKGVSKCYRVFDDQLSRFLHAVWPMRTKGVEEVWALRDVNFEIKRGEAVAIIGKNGGGKSTLLEILTGTLASTAGTVIVNGRVSALLELGSGFNPEYSGRDNVILNGLLLGLGKEEILSRFAEIEVFADIGAAIDRPVKTYSSGMMMRLAFAVQVLCDPDILIIDEALSVGDFFFQQKCLSFIKALCAKGVTLLFVSHDMGTVRDLCNRAVFLQSGGVVFDGAASKAISLFFADHSVIHRADSNQEEVASEHYILRTLKCADILDKAIWKSKNIVDNFEGKLLAVTVCDPVGNSCLSFKIGDEMVLTAIYIKSCSTECHSGFVIKNKFDQVVTGASSYFSGVPVADIPGLERQGNVVACKIKMKLLLEAGEYSLDVTTGITTEKNRSDICDRTPTLGPITVAFNYENEIAEFVGQVGLPVVTSVYPLNNSGYGL